MNPLKKLLQRGKDKNESPQKLLQLQHMSSVFRKSVRQKEGDKKEKKQHLKFHNVFQNLKQDENLREIFCSTK